MATTQSKSFRDTIWIPIILLGIACSARFLQTDAGKEFLEKYLPEVGGVTHTDPANCAVVLIEDVSAKPTTWFGAIKTDDSLSKHFNDEKAFYRCIDKDENGKDIKSVQWAIDAAKDGVKSGLTYPVIVMRSGSKVTLKECPQKAEDVLSTVKKTLGI